jgi:aminocarboxymuconate-semialdehyde decarboxylase
MIKRLERIETHAHYMPAPIYGAAGDYGPERIVNEALGQRTFRAGRWKSEASTFRRTPGQVGKPAGTENTDASERLGQMDKLNVDVMGISASPMIYCYGAPSDDGIRYARVYNDAMAEYCSASPDRLFFIPTLPMQDVRAAITESERTRSLGGRGVNIGTDCIAQMDLDDERLMPFYEYCEAERLTIWLHPAPIGTDDPNYDPAKNAEDRYSFGWLLGYPYRETVAFGNLVFSGTLDRFPNLKICIPHGGGFVPFQLGRLEYASQKKLTASIRNRRPASEYLTNFYFDNVVHDARARKLLMQVMGPDHIFVGSNYGGWDWVDGFAYATDMADSPEALYKLCAGNAIDLFQLSGMGRTME